jgi:Tol biopolymer transport system component
MGEVYRAHDTRLRRDVALKVIPDHLAGHGDRVARFEREAQLLASLSHPNIAALLGVEESGPIRALVMELVDGPTLAERLATGPFRIDEALPIARQVAEAIEYAHEQRVLHRDLKPANIKLTAGGRVKVLDFGIAKALVDAADSHAPTMTGDLTAYGVTVGTAAYMAPEQARGAAATKSADIWAFGATLFEMLTGCRTFDAPPWDLLPSDTPPAVGRLLRRCLDPDPRRRMHDIGDARVEIEDAIASPPTAAPVTSQRSRQLHVVLLAAAATAAVAAIGTAIYLRPEPALSSRLSLTSPGAVQAQIAPAVSPDGRHVALVATDPSGQPTLWVRDLDAAAPRQLAGTEEARHPFWSPDGRSIGFWASGSLKRVPAEGGAVLTVADTAAPWGGTWGRDDVILFVRRVGELARVSAGGGPVTTVLQGPSLAWPQFLPDGRRFLFAGSPTPGATGVHVGSLQSRDTTRILETPMQAMYAEPGWLLFVRNEDVMAQRFDAGTLRLSGEPSLVAQGVYTVPAGSRVSYSVSGTGVLVYTNASLLDTQLISLDRSGKKLDTIGAPGRFYARRPQLSPDGRRIAIEHGRFGASEDVWLHDLADGSVSRLTLDEGAFRRPLWSRDGKRILYARPPGRLVVRAIDPPGPEQAVADLRVTLEDWSPDGAHVLHLVRSAAGLNEIWSLPIAGGAKPVPLVQTHAHAVQAQFSPNGKWVAYTSMESGRNEVYAVSFPDGRIKRQVSSAGGVQPRWRADGAELFFLSLDRQMMAVPIADPISLRTDTPRTLFRAAPIVAQGAQEGQLFTLYDVTADGQRFIVNAVPDDPPYTVVLNWAARLKR